MIIAKEMWKKVENKKKSILLVILVIGLHILEQFFKCFIDLIPFLSSCKDDLAWTEN